MKSRDDIRRASKPSIDSVLIECFRRLESDEGASVSAMLSRFKDYEKVVRSCLDEVRLSGPSDSGSFPEIDGFRMIGRIGKGSSGEVFVAEQLSVGRLAAIKVLRRDGMEARSRVNQEVIALSRVRHPNVVTIFSAEPLQSTPYIALELILGTGLNAIYRSREERGVTQKDIVRWCRDVALGLQAVHEQGVIHRDVKPSNIRVTSEGRPVLFDFGSSCLVDESEFAEKESMTGTIPYAAPEQLVPTLVPSSGRTDVYSLGAVLYEGLCGRPPFADTNPSLLLRQILEREPTMPRKIQPRIARDLEAVVMMSLEKSPSMRYKDARAFADDLTAILELRSIKATKRTLFGLGARWVNRHRLLTGLVTLVVLTSTLAVALSHSRAQRLRRFHAQGVSEAQALAAGRLIDYRRMADVQLMRDLEREAEEDLWPARPWMVSRMNRWAQSAEDLVSRLGDYEVLLRAVENRGNQDESGLWLFDSEEEGFQHDVLCELVQGVRRIDESKSGVRANVEGRNEIAKSIEAETLLAFRQRWLDAVADIANHPLYDGLQVNPQLGLIPLARDPDSTLWEFSVWETGECPQKNSSTGRWEMKGETAVILVLIPRTQLDFGETLVSIDPFFLSKYEMSQGQWKRIVGVNPSEPQATQMEFDPMSYPVQLVSWNDCQKWLGRIDLTIPTGTQWEYGARGGSSSRWHTGNAIESLEGYANIADESLKGVPGLPIEVGFSDGFFSLAPIGSLRPNAFGIHDVHGNVSEWTRDVYGSDPKELISGEGERVAQDRNLRVIRGGSYTNVASLAALDCVSSYESDIKVGNFGIRPACRLKSFHWSVSPSPKRADLESPIHR